jgi:E3 ubiquitin-protein ligase MARCH6
VYIRYLPNPWSGLLPLKWNVREPISEIPIDLLFVHTIIPPTIRYFQPKDFFFRWFQAYWKFLSRELRLTSYMFGGRSHDEEIASHWTWKNLPYIRNVPWVAAIQGPAPTERDGGFMRCPAVDNVERAPDTQILVTVNEFGQALDDKGRKVIQDQDTEARNAHRNPQEDYTIVYTPPRFRIRVITFITILWATVATCVVAAVGGPIFLGRVVLEHFTSRPLHDGYSFIVGSYLTWAIYLLLKIPFKLKSSNHRAKFIIDGLSWFAQVAWLALCCGLIIPILMAFVIEGYLFMPARRILSKTDPPVLYLWEEWALGVVLCKIAMRVVRMQRPTRISRAVEAFQRRGLKNPDAITATKELLGPLIIGMLGMLILPPLFIYGVWRILPIQMPEVFPFWACFPPIFVAAAFIQSNMQISRYGHVWAQDVRDKEFLVEMKLKNLEPGEVDAAKAEPTPAGDAAPDQDTDSGSDDDVEVDEDD